MKTIIVTREILDIYDKYDHDFGLLDERWASVADRQKVTLEQSMLFSEYVEMLNFIKLDNIPCHLKQNALKRINEIEKVMDCEVAEILKQRAKHLNVQANQ